MLRHPGGDRVIARVLASVPTAGLDAVLVAVELVVESGVLSAEHVENLLERLHAAPVPACVETSLQWTEAPLAATTTCVVPRHIPMRRQAMRDVTAELKELRLHGMTMAWEEIAGQGKSAGVDTSRWLIEHLLQAEHTGRAMRSVRPQMFAARIALHRDLAGFGFDFETSKVDKPLVRQLVTMAFTESAQSTVFIGGPDTGNTHLATAIGAAGIATYGQRVRFYSTVDLNNAMEKVKRDGHAGRIARGFQHSSMVAKSRIKAREDKRKAARPTTSLEPF